MSAVHAYLVADNILELAPAILRHYQSFCARVFIIDATPEQHYLEMCAEMNVAHLGVEAGLTDDPARDAHLRSETYKAHSCDSDESSQDGINWNIVTNLAEVLYHPYLHSLLEIYQREDVTVPLVRGLVVDTREFAEDWKPLVELWPNARRLRKLDKRVLFRADFTIRFAPDGVPYGPAFELMRQTTGYRTSADCELVLLDFSSKQVDEGVYRKLLMAGGAVDKGCFRPEPDLEGLRYGGRLTRGELRFLEDVSRGYSAVDAPQAVTLVEILLRWRRNPALLRMRNSLAKRVKVPQRSREITKVGAVLDAGRDK